MNYIVSRGAEPLWIIDASLIIFGNRTELQVFNQTAAVKLWSLKRFFCSVSISLLFVQRRLQKRLNVSNDGRCSFL